MTREQISELKQGFITQRQDYMRNRITDLQKKLYDEIFNKVISLFETKDGMLLLESKNLNLLTEIDKVFKSFQVKDFTPVIAQFGKDLLKIGKLNKEYFAIASEKHLTEVNKVSVIAEEKASKQLGLTKDGKIQNKSFLDKLIKDETLKKQIKKTVLKSVTGKKPVAELVKELTKQISGNQNVRGGLVRHFDQFIRDTYTQFDSTSAKVYATGLGMQAFIYQGGKITSSRCFCEKRDGKVLTIDESEGWVNILNKDCGPIWNEKTDGKYIPTTMRGGYECRHSLDFISNSLAIHLRPDLKGVL